MSEHTKGQVKYRGGETLAVVETLGGREADPIAHCGGPNALGNARRVAACWNAFENVRTDLVELVIMQAAADAMEKLPAVKAELTAARALLREVLDEDGASLDTEARIREYLDEDQK